MIAWLRARRLQPWRVSRLLSDGRLLPPLGFCRVLCGDGWQPFCGRRCCRRRPRQLFVSLAAVRVATLPPARLRPLAAPRCRLAIRKSRVRAFATSSPNRAPPLPSSSTARTTNCPLSTSFRHLFQPPPQQHHQQKKPPRPQSTRARGHRSEIRMPVQKSPTSGFGTNFDRI